MRRTTTAFVSAVCFLLLTAPAVAGPVEPAEPPVAPKEDVPAPPPDLFARDSYRVDRLICPFRGKIRYEPGDIQCGLLQVPENREDPRSRFIELHFIVFKAGRNKEGDKKEKAGATSGLAPGKRDDPVIFLSGGPGARASMYVKRLKEHRLLEHRDLYLLEQRGIGTSAEFCRSFFTRKPEADDVATFEAALASYNNDLVDCATNATRAGVDLKGYNTLENARDVKALRRALKIKKWNVWGISYGSILGQAYIKEDPEGIRAVVLDGVVPLDARGMKSSWRVAHAYVRSLEKLEALCEAQPDCAERYPDLGERIRQAVKSVEGAPIPVPVKDTELYPTGKPHLFQDAAGYLPFMLLYEQKHYPAMPGLIHAWADLVERRQGPAFKVIALMAHSIMSISSGMHHAVKCLDGITQRQAVAGPRDIAEHPILGAAMGSVSYYKRSAALCRQLGMAPRDARQYAPVKTDLPTLMVAGEMDPITPPPLAREVLPGFSRATYVEFPYTGHGATRSVECAGEMLNKFFDAPDKKPDISCARTVKPPRFLAPLFLTTAAARAMATMLENKKALAAPAVWGGASLLITLLAFFVLTGGFLGRLLTRSKPAPSSWARLAAWLAATLAVAALAILTGAFAASFQISEMLPMFGLVPWARYGATAGHLAGLAGFATLALTVRAQFKNRLPANSLTGFLLTGLAAVGLSIFLVVWDLSLF